MTAAEALLRAEELMLEARQVALDKAEKEPDAVGKHTYDCVASTHKADAEICRMLRGSL
jgi:hypothetical protein